MRWWWILFYFNYIVWYYFYNSPPRIFLKLLQIQIVVKYWCVRTMPLQAVTSLTIWIKSKTPENLKHLIVFPTMLIKPLLLSIKLSDGFIFWAEGCYKQIWLIIELISLCKCPLKCDDSHHDLKLCSHVDRKF